MRRLVLTARPLVIALSVAAAVSVAGTAAAAPAHRALAHRAPASAARRPVTTVTWHKLRLLHSWTTGRTKLFAVANPAYAISGGIVYLDGTLKQPSGTNDEFAVLPRAARPRHDEFITVLTGLGAGTPGTLLILPDGSMRAYSDSGSAQTYTSFSAVSYPVASARWHKLGLRNGWKPAIHNLGAATPSYVVSGGVVYLTGSAAGGSSKDALAVLPKGARPMSRLYFAAYNFGSAVGSVVIQPSGVITSYGAASSSQTSLDSLSFPVARAKGFRWHKIKLALGWASSEPQWSSGDPAYAIVGPVVYLAGSMHFNPAVPHGNAIFGTFPKAAVPPNTLGKLVYADAGATGAVTIVPNFGLAGSNPPSPAQDFTSLAGIAYPRNS